MSPATTGGGLRVQAVSGFLWTVLQKWSVRLSTFVAFLVLGRLLSPVEFGIVALAMTFIAILTVVADAGFATYLVQAKQLTERATHTAFWIATSSGLVLALAVAALGRPLAAALDVDELAVVLPALAVSLVFTGLSSVPAALLTRELRYRQLAVRQVVATLLSVVVAVALAFGGAGVWALVAQTLVRTVVASVALWLASDYRPRAQFSGPDAARMLAYSGKAMSAQILAAVRDQGEALLIGAIAGPVALGLWTVALRVVNVVGDLLGSVIGTVAVPLFARVQSEPTRLARAISGTGGVGALLLAPALLALSLLSPELIPAVFGEQWTGATTVASLLAVRGLLLALISLDRAVLLHTGRAGGELRVIAVLTVLHVALVGVVAPHGVEVLAVVLLVETLLVAPIRPLLVHRWLGVPYSAYAGPLRVLAAAAVSAAAVLGVVVALDVTGGATYPLVLVGGGLLYGVLVLLLARPVVGDAAGAVRSVLHRRRGPRAGAQPVPDVAEPAVQPLSGGPQ